MDTAKYQRSSRTAADRLDVTIAMEGRAGRERRTVYRPVADGKHP